MTRPLPQLRRPLLHAAPGCLAAVAILGSLLLAPARPAPAQTLKLASLRVFPSDVVGPWVSYRVRTRSGRSPMREYRQRVAIVGHERVGKGHGYWVELKTVDRAGTRYERGLFAASTAGIADDELPDPGHGSEVAAQPGQPLRLVRYQMLAPGGKLYEYPVASATSARAGGGVSSFELFEFDPSRRPVRRFLGPDTLRIGRRVVPSVLEWTSRSGADDWGASDDTTYTYRLRLTQALWRNAAVPITGFARSLFRVTTHKVPRKGITSSGASVVEPVVPAPDSIASAAGASAAGADSLRPAADTLAAFAPADTTVGPTSLQPGDGRLLSWTELVLEDIGADAVAEVTQTAEPAPASEVGPPAELLH